MVTAAGPAAAQGRLDQWPTLRQTFVRRSQLTPHPAVARIIVNEGDGTSVGSGTLVDAHGAYGLVVTNWHVVRDVKGPVSVVFPDGFRSAAQILKVDRDWDLAALAVWRPSAAPVPLARQAPRPGDLLTIAGYGAGQYRSTSGHCTQYVAPEEHLPYEMVELAAAARQGDSGGPIFNERGELAGVLFGSTGRTTSGSFSGRVERFLDSVRTSLRQPDYGAIAQRGPDAGSQAPSGAPPPAGAQGVSSFAPPWRVAADSQGPSGARPGTANVPGQAAGDATPPLESVHSAVTLRGPDGTRPIAPPVGDSLAARHTSPGLAADREYLPVEAVEDPAREAAAEPPRDQASLLGATPLEWAKSVLALVGLVALALQGLRWLGPKPADD